MNIRYVISHMNKDGMRAMTYAQQGRNTQATREKAEQDLKDLLTVNTEDRLMGIFGTQAIGTFEVSAVECWDGHNDPKGCWVKEELNPGQVCLTGELKRIIDEVDKRK